MTETHDGGCLCGALRYRATGSLQPINICHCTECRETTGGAPASTACSGNGFQLLADETLRWFPGPTSATHGERGFCSTCGSYVLFRIPDDPLMYLTAASLDEPVDLPVEGHIWWASRAAWEAADGRPTADAYPEP